MSDDDYLMPVMDDGELEAKMSNHGNNPSDQPVDDLDSNVVELTNHFVFTNGAS